MSSRAEYNKLRAIWYGKLKAEGFNDIESDDENLRSWSSRFATKRARELFAERGPYYNMAGKFLHHYPFAAPMDRVIWEYHSEGLSVRDIATALKKVGVTKTNHTTVWQIVTRLENIMLNMYLGKSDDE